MPLLPAVPWMGPSKSSLNLMASSFLFRSYKQNWTHFLALKPAPLQGCHLGEWRTSPSTQQPKPDHTETPPSHLFRLQVTSIWTPHNSAPALTPGLLRMAPLHLLPGPPTAFLEASNALTSYPVVYWEKPVSPEPNSHCPLSPFSRIICGSLNLCPNGRTSYSFLNTSHSPKLPSLHASPSWNVLLHSNSCFTILSPFEILAPSEHPNPKQNPFIWSFMSYFITNILVPTMCQGLC